MKHINHNEKCLCTISSSSELEKIRNFVILCAEKFGFDDKESHNIALAVDEACSNLIRYGFKYNSKHDIQVNISSNDEHKFVVSISDNALPFNPTKVESPNMEEYFRQFKKGGLGIHLMKLVMDEIDYIPKSKNNPRNTLLLKKYLKI
ncbi:MAG: ATP-binding protein [Candidatus Kapaibacterium sp.]|jgi:serine/threonine-protein kinase RsbW